MSTIHEVHDGCTTLISDIGRDRLATEQRMNRTTGIHTAIFAGSAIGMVVTFAALVIKQLMGA
ncbi:hypothetical protein [Paraburkholderia antibiotica]|uniref:Uncharacterized protein n=1 Tax=Paraburkholderia antibiotica TaxID=2728839 RepID=A0A7Y0A1R5_9BURK|nr:hypothetical protein [Paraburkholderia antibiotica]NML34897.1 hypothetical protein [Paraburkholderia antibiotica]